jgi:hypothetical protein
MISCNGLLVKFISHPPYVLIIRLFLLGAMDLKLTLSNKINHTDTSIVTIGLIYYINFPINFNIYIN